MRSNSKMGSKFQEWATDPCGPNFWGGAKLHPQFFFWAPGNFPKAGPSRTITTKGTLLGGQGSFLFVSRLALEGFSAKSKREIMCYIYI